MDIKENEKIIDVTIKGESISGRLKNSYLRAKEFCKEHKKEVVATLVIVLPIIRDMEKTRRSRQISKRECEQERDLIYRELMRKIEMNNCRCEELCRRVRNGEFV